MPALNFTVFIDKVEAGLSGSEIMGNPDLRDSKSDGKWNHRLNQSNRWRLRKRQTIRSERNHPIKVGDILYLYTGMRRAGVRRLGVVRCREIVKVNIWSQGVIWIWMGDQKVLRIEGMRELDKFAWLDGFESWVAMRDWFCRGLHPANCFAGDLIVW